MLSVLICSDHQDNIVLLQRFLASYGYKECIACHSVKAAEKQAALHSFALIIVDLPFTKDAHEISFLYSLQEAYPALMLVLIQKQYMEDVRIRVEKCGIFTVAKPLSLELLSQLLAFVNASYYRIRQMNLKQKQLVDKIKEIKLVDRAKCLLIEHEYMSEEQAHKQIEKDAMNERVARGEIAKRIIKEYEE